MKTTDDEQSLRGHVSFVVLDCSAMTYIDSVGVGTLLQVSIPHSALHVTPSPPCVPSCSRVDAHRNTTATLQYTIPELSRQYL